ncbi:MAG: sulfur carrier protein ThiS [Thermoproteota archaeon]
MAIKIIVNGKEVITEVQDLISLLKNLNMDIKRKGIAIAINGEIIPRNEWEKTKIKEGDKIEIVHIVFGG